MEAEKALDFLMRIAQGIATMFGPGCETLIHDMTRAGHPIVAIFNGQMSGRGEGSTEDIFGDDGYYDQTVYAGKDYVNHLVVTRHNQSVKSSTFNLKGDGYHYAFGINFDFTPLMNLDAAIEGLMRTGGDLSSAISDEAQSQLDELFDACHEAMGKPLDQMRKDDRIAFIELLHKRGAFNFQRAVAVISQKMGVSRYTVYKYLHEIEERKGA